MDTKKRVLSLISLLLLFALTGCGLESDIPTEKFIERARGHIEKGDMKSGIIELKNALQKKPDSVEARILLGQTYHTIGLGKEAEKEFRKALELGVQGDSIKINLGDALLLQSKFDQILEEVQPGKGTSQPNLAKIYRLRGDAELGLGQLEEGCVFFRKAVDLDDTNVPAYWGLANCAMARKDTDEARRQINIALKLEPENASTWTRIGDIERFSGSAEDAEAAYTKALEISPESKEALAGRILTRIAKNDVASAKQDLNKLTAVSPNSVSTNMLQGIVFYLEGKFDNALEVLQKAQSMQPDNAGVIRLLGLVHYQQGNLNQAVAELTQYLNFDLNDTLVRKVLGASFLRLASPDRAIEVLMPVLSKDQSDPQILEMASAAYTGSQNFTEAIRMIEQAIAAADQDIALRYRLGLTLWAAGEKQKAQTTLETAASEDKKKQMVPQTLIFMYLQQKEFRQALDLASQLEKDLPDDALYPTLKGAAYLGMEDYANARKSFERVVELQPTSVSAALNLVQLDVRENQPAVARKRLLDILQTDKGNLRAMLGLAGLAEQAGDEQEFLTWMEKAVQVQPPALQPRVLLTRYYLGKNQLTKALALAREAEAIQAGNPEVLELLGTIQLKQNEAASARVTLEQAVKANPNSAQAYFMLASAQARLGLRDESLAALKRALTLDPAYLQAQIALITMETEAGRYDDAVEVAQQIHAQHPQSVMGLVLEGDIRMAQRHFSAAVAAYEGAWAKAPSDSLLIKLHKALSRAGSVKKADTYLVEWVEAHPEAIEARLYQARLSELKGESAQAISQYQDILKIEPGQLAALNNLALLYQRDNDPRARSLAEQASQLAPDNPAILDTLGWVLLQQGEIKTGSDIIHKAAQAAPGNPEIRYHLAVALARTGEIDRARKELQALLDSGLPFSQSAQARALLETL